jgi:uncharacterized protein (TIGR03085 family)
MTRERPPLSQRERHALADLLLELGPDAPTLCQGWRSADLAAHLVVRDTRPDAVPGMVVPFGPLQAWTEKVMERARDTMTWPALVDRLRNGPPPWLRPFDSQLNTLEYFVHHEDLRRAQEGWEPRPLAGADEAALWRSLRIFVLAFLGRQARRSAARLEAPGQPPIVLRQGGQGPVVKGPVGEVVLWVAGRRGVARVSEEGE